MTPAEFREQHVRWGHPVTATLLVLREGSIASLRCALCCVTIIDAITVMRPPR